MIVWLLSILDIIIGLCLFNPKIFEKFILILGLLILLKGIFSLLGSLSAKYYFDWMGIIDLVSGILLLSLSFEFYIFEWILMIFWIFPIFKGIYSIITTL